MALGIEGTVGCWATDCGPAAGGREGLRRARTWAAKPGSKTTRKKQTMASHRRAKNEGRADEDISNLRSGATYTFAGTVKGAIAPGSAARFRRRWRGSRR